MNLIKENNKSHIITLVKAFGIIFMVLAHSMPPEYLVWKIIYCFHMPLFFIMSGYCFKDKYLHDTKQFIVRKIKGIYLPMVLFSLPILLLHNIFCSLYIYDPTWIYSWKDFLWNILRIISRMSHNEGMLGTFWFLKDLFFGNLIFYFLYKLILKIPLDKKYYLPIVLSTLFLLSEICSVLHLRIPYFGIDEYCINAAIFIAVGYWWSLKDWKINTMLLWLIGIITIALKIYFIPETIFRNTTSITLLVFAVPAVVATMITWNICRFIYEYMSKMIITTLEKIGNYTLWIMALHFLFFKLVSYIFILINDLPITNLIDFPVLNVCINTPYMWGIYTIVGVILPLVTGEIFSYSKTLYHNYFNVNYKHER